MFMPAQQAMPPPERAAFQAWLAADASIGPQRAYHLACRLPEQLRPFGRGATALADWALAHTLFWRGRFEESRARLAAIRLEVFTPEAGAAFNLDLLIPAQLSWALALLGETAAALKQADHALEQVQADAQHGAIAAGYLGMLHCFLDAPEATLAWVRRLRAGVAIGRQAGLLHTANLLEYWALSRLGESPDEAGAHAALAALRRHGSAHEARAFSLYALGQFHQSPQHAVTQLDAALDLNARHGLHHWEARLLHLKSQSLDAGGQLHAASRFLALAHETAQRQGAKLFLKAITGIESRTHADPDMEYAA